MFVSCPAEKPEATSMEELLDERERSCKWETTVGKHDGEEIRRGGKGTDDTTGLEEREKSDP